MKRRFKNKRGTMTSPPYLRWRLSKRNEEDEHGLWASLNKRCGCWRREDEMLEKGKGQWKRKVCFYPFTMTPTEKEKNMNDITGYMHQINQQYNTQSYSKGLKVSPQ